MKKFLIIITAFIAVLNIFTACADKEVQRTANETSSNTETLQEPDASLFTLAPMTPAEKTPEQEEDEGLYSSYAYMRSFDPDTGIAQFDYFEMLTGAEAVDYLINCEGYCSLVAETEVEVLDEGEFIENNQSGELRQIDIKNVAIKLLYYKDGSMAEEQSIDIDYEGFKALWDKDSYLIVKHFYYITVDEDKQEVISIEQVGGFN